MYVVPIIDLLQGPIYPMIHIVILIMQICGKGIFLESIIGWGHGGVEDPHLLYEVS